MAIEVLTTAGIEGVHQQVIGAMETVALGLFPHALLYARLQRFLQAITGHVLVVELADVLGDLLARRLLRVALVGDGHCEGVLHALGVAVSGGIAAVHLHWL